MAMSCAHWHSTRTLAERISCSVHSSGPTQDKCTDEGMLIFSCTWLDWLRKAVEGLPFGIVSAAPNILELLIPPEELGILWSLIFTAILA